MKAILAITTAGLAASTATADIAYGIDDTSHSNSQLIMWDTADGSVTNLSNGSHIRYDLEASGINAFNQWFMIGGGNGIVQDQVFQASTLDGSLTNLGTLQFSNSTSGRREVVGASFNNQSGRLWISRERDGFYSFDTNDLTSLTKEFNLNKNVEAMAWNSAGSMLYFMDQKSLYSWNKEQGKKLLKRDLFNKGVESLEFDMNGNLLAGIDSGHDQFSLINIDLDTLELSVFGLYDAPSGDLESIAFSPHIIPAPSTVALLGIGGYIGLRRRR